MKRLIFALFALLLGTFPLTASATTIKIPVPPVPIIVPEPPLFLLLPGIGFRAAVDIDDDMFLIDDRYYVYRDNAWYFGPSYRGPWKTIHYKSLPPGLRKHKMKYLHEEREREHRRYRDDRDYDRRRVYRPARHHDDDRDYRDHDRRGDDDRNDRHREKDHRKDQDKHRGKGKGGRD